MPSTMLAGHALHGDSDMTRGAAAVLADGLNVAEATRAIAVLSAMPAVDMNRREAEWRDDGWSGLPKGTLPDPERGRSRVSTAARLIPPVGRGLDWI